MRRLMLTVTMAGLVCLPVMAQRGGFGFGGRGMENMLLALPDIQKELKMTADQTKAVTEAQKAMQASMAKAKEDGDFSGFGKTMEEYGKALAKVKEGLSAPQSKRLSQIELQIGVKNKSVASFRKEDIAKTMKLTTKQKTMLSDLEKDTKEIMEDAQGDMGKMREARQKVQKMNQETYEKLTASFTEEQKTTLKDLQGDKFEGNVDFGFGKGKGKGKGTKKDDF